MKKNIALGLLVAGSFICLIFFQNCSKISTQDLVERSGEYKMTANNEDAGNIVNNDVIADVIADEAKPDVFEPKQAEEKKEDNPQPSEEVIVANDKNKEHVAEEADDDKDDSKAIAACLNKNFKHSITGSVFNNLHGKFKIVSNQIEEMSNNRGKFIVQSTSSESLVKKISNHHGKLILCSLNVQLIEGGHGKLVLINSHVKEILGHKGKVKSINSTIEKFSGKLKVVAL